MPVSLALASRRLPRDVPKRVMYCWAPVGERCGPAWCVNWVAVRSAFPPVCFEVVCSSSVADRFEMYASIVDFLNPPSPACADARVVNDPPGFCIILALAHLPLTRRLQKQVTCPYPSSRSVHVPINILPMSPSLTPHYTFSHLHSLRDIHSLQVPLANSCTPVTVRSRSQRVRLCRGQ